MYSQLVLRQGCTLTSVVFLVRNSNEFIADVSAVASVTATVVASRQVCAVAIHTIVVHVSFAAFVDVYKVLQK